MQDPFPASDFDDWAETYDRNVLDVSTFPFIGYDLVLNAIVSKTEPQPGLSVLDLGTGTGNLAVPFYEAGCDLWCTDFSESMLSKARLKLQGAHLFLHDLRLPLPVELERTFDRIVSAYVFHHFELEKKADIIRCLSANHLKPGGYIVIGDISFPDAARRDGLRAELGEQWEEEFYWLADEAIAAMEKVGMHAQYEQVSPCAGVFVIHPA
jgi:putative AdoMet-dependent methyltransferase